MSMVVLAYRHYICLVVCYQIHAMEIAHRHTWPTISHCIRCIPTSSNPIWSNKMWKGPIEQMDCLMNPSLLTFTSFKLNSRIWLVTNSNHLLGGKWSVAWQTRCRCYQQHECYIVVKVVQHTTHCTSVGLYEMVRRCTGAVLSGHPGMCWSCQHSRAEGSWRRAPPHHWWSPGRRARSAVGCHWKLALYWSRLHGKKFSKRKD